MGLAVTIALLHALLVAPDGKNRNDRSERALPSNEPPDDCGGHQADRSVPVPRDLIE
jgi:hypothetical protein